MNAQQPSGFRHGAVFLFDELAGVADLGGIQARARSEARTARPVLVRSTMSERSKSAMPANTARPAGAGPPRPP